MNAIINENKLKNQLSDYIKEKYPGLSTIDYNVISCTIYDHEERYRALLNNIETQAVFKKAGIVMWECRNCGHLVIGEEAPVVCPVCAHPQAFFEVHKENY